MTLDTTTGLTTARRHNLPSPLVIVAAITALICIGVGALVIGEFAPKGANTAVVTGFILGTVAPTIMGLLALLRGDHAVQVGQANAERLVATTETVAAIAKDVNGHLTRHDDLAEKLTDTADSLAKLATAATPVARVASTRTRTTDVATPGSLVNPALADAPPVDEAQA